MSVMDGRNRAEARTEVAGAGCPGWHRRLSQLSQLLPPSQHQHPGADPGKPAPAGNADHPPPRSGTQSRKALLTGFLIRDEVTVLYKQKRSGPGWTLSNPRVTLAFDRKQPMVGEADASLGHTRACHVFVLRSSSQWRRLWVLPSEPPGSPGSLYQAWPPSLPSVAFSSVHSSSGDCPRLQELFAYRTGSNWKFTPP